MTDTAISPHLDVSAFKAMGSAKSRRVSVNPENLSSHTSSTSSKDCYFALPSASMGMINGQNSALQFDLTSAGATASIANGSGSSLIESMELIIGNQSVELLQSYATFSALIEDHQSSSRAINSHGILNGGASTASKQGAEIAVGATVRITVPLYSAVIGTMCSQYCPAVDGIRLRLTLAPHTTALKVANVVGSNGVITGSGVGTPTYVMTDITLQMDYLDINPAVYNEMMAEAGGVFKIHGSGVSSFSSTISLAEANHSLLIPARFSSVKNYFTTFRESASVGLKSRNSCGARINPKIKSYSYRVDGRNYPSVAVKAFKGTTPVAGEAFSELVKCFHATHSPDFDTVYGLPEYNELGTLGAVATRASDVLTNARVLARDRGSFAIGLDWEESGYGQLRGLVSGMDTINSNTFLQLQTENFSAGDFTDVGDSVTDALGCLVDTFAVHDLILELNMLDGSVSVSK